MKGAFRRILLGVFCFYISGMIVLLFFQSRGFGIEQPFMDYLRQAVNLVPFHTINGYIDAWRNGTMNWEIPFRNLLGNIVLFVPLGIFLPVLFRSMGKLRNWLPALLVILLSIETVQLLTRRGSFDIDDLILNTFGALLGFGMYAVVKRMIFAEVGQEDEKRLV